MMHALGKLDTAANMLEDTEDREDALTLADVFQTLREVFKDELGQHLTFEEDHLFFAMERYMGREQGPLAVMLYEHEELNRLVTAYDEAVGRWRLALEDGSAPTAEREAAEELVSAARSVSSLLTQHALKEDQVLFPMARQILSEEEIREVAKGLSGLQR